MIPADRFEPWLTVTVVIPYYEAPEELAITLAALERQTYPADLFDVIIVDDGSAIPLELSEPTPLRVKVIHQPDQGFGAARARNNGARNSDSDILAFLDCDMVPEDDWLMRHARWHHSANDLVSLGFRLHVEFDGITPDMVRNRDGSLGDLLKGRPAESPQWLVWRMARSDDLDSDDDDLYGAVTSGNLVVSAEFFNLVGGFDESFTQWGSEDTEFGWRAYMAGTVFVPERQALCWHQGPGATLSKEEEASLIQQRGKVAHLIPHRRIRTAVRGRSYKLPQMVVTITPGSADKEAIFATTEQVLSSNFDDLVVWLPTQPALTDNIGEHRGANEREHDEAKQRYNRHGAEKEHEREHDKHEREHDNIKKRGNEHYNEKEHKREHSEIKERGREREHHGEEDERDNKTTSNDSGHKMAGRDDRFEWLHQQFDPDPRVVTGEPGGAVAAYPNSPFHVTIPAGADVNARLLGDLMKGIRGSASGSADLPSSHRVTITRTWAIRRAQRSRLPLGDVGDIVELDSKNPSIIYGKRRPSAIVRAIKRALGMASKILRLLRLVGKSMMRIRSPRDAWRFICWFARGLGLYARKLKRKLSDKRGEKRRYQHESEQNLRHDQKLKPAKASESVPQHAKSRVSHKQTDIPKVSQQRSNNPRAGYPLGAEIVALDRCASTVFADSRLVASDIDSDEHIDVIVVDSPDSESRSNDQISVLEPRPAVIVLSECDPQLSVQAFDPHFVNPIGWTADHKPAAATLRDFLPATVGSADTAQQRSQHTTNTTTTLGSADTAQQRSRHTTTTNTTVTTESADTAQQQRPPHTTATNTTVTTESADTAQQQRPPHTTATNATVTAGSSDAAQQQRSRHTTATNATVTAGSSDAARRLRNRLLGERLTDLRSLHHLDDSAEFHVDATSRAAVNAALAAAGVVVRITDDDPSLRELLGSELYDLMASESVTAASTHQREQLSIAMRRAALRDHSLRGRARKLLSRAGIESPPASVSVLLATRRPGRLLAATQGIAAQTYPRMEVVFALHGEGFEPADVDQALEQISQPTEVVRIPADQPLGTVLNAAVEASSGSLLTKFDDDDYYSPNHLWDLVLAHEYSQAELVGKAAEYVYLSRLDKTVHRHSFHKRAETYPPYPHVAGGVLMISRHHLAEAGGWRRAPRHVDAWLAKDVKRMGGDIYWTHGSGYLLVRHSDGHTWSADESHFLGAADEIRDGCDFAFAGF